MNLGSILASLYRDFGYPASPPPVITTRLTAFINRAHRETMTLPELSRLRVSTTLATITANTARTGLPADVLRVLGITDRTNQIKLAEVPLASLRLTDPGQANTGSYPWRFAVIGNQATQLQPATTGLWAVSSSASDTTQTVAVEGLLTGGYPFVPAVTTLTGTTRVAIGSRTDYIEVTKFYLSSAGVGFVSLYDAVSAGNELARIPIGDTYSRYQAIEWYPIPTSSTPEYVDFERRIFDLVASTDEPLLPVDFHDVLELGAKVCEYEQLKDSYAVSARQAYTARQSALKSWVMNDGDRIASLRPTRLGWNRLGGTYPNQGWPG